MTQTDVVSRRPDRRIRKTRASLHSALLHLLSEHEYAAITVEQVIQRADVARATFYAHYADKDELFTDLAAEMTNTLVEQASAVAPVTPKVFGGAAVFQLFLHAERHPHIYRAMLHGAAAGAPLHHFRAALGAAYKQLLEKQQAAWAAATRLPLEFLVRAWVGEHLALVAWWLEEHPPYTAADLTKMRLQLMIEGPIWARGLEPGQITFDEGLFDQIVASAADEGPAQIT